jgi:hypothetical protein
VAYTVRLTTRGYPTRRTSMPKMLPRLPFSFVSLDVDAIVAKGSGGVEARRTDVLPRIHAIDKLARQMETSDAAKPVLLGKN